MFGKEIDPINHNCNWHQHHASVSLSFWPRIPINKVYLGPGQKRGRLKSFLLLLLPLAQHSTWHDMFPTHCRGSPLTSDPKKRRWIGMRRGGGGGEWRPPSQVLSFSPPPGMGRLRGVGLKLWGNSIIPGHGRGRRSETNVLVVQRFEWSGGWRRTVEDVWQQL